MSMEQITCDECGGQFPKCAMTITGDDCLCPICVDQDADLLGWDGHLWDDEDEEMDEP